MAQHSSRIDLSLSALRGNLTFLRQRIGPHPVLSMVVKANAYGHGIDPMITMARRCGVHHFSVASGAEGELVREVGGPDCRVMVMGILYDEDLPWAIETGVEFFVFDLPRLRRAAEIAKELCRPALVHLEVETGGNRTGLGEEDLVEAYKLLRRHGEHLRFSGLCTHLAGAETLATKFRIERQLVRFRAALRDLEKRKMRPEFLHCASSAAALTMPEETGLDLVRTGVACYGFFPSSDVYNLHLMRVNKVRDNPLRRVLTWKTEIMHVKPVRKDEFIGYGTSYQAEQDMRIAVIPLGYANGYPREMSNKGHVLIHGYKAPIVGLINMNLFMVDVSRIPQAAVGDVVVLIGRQKNNVIPISSFSEFSSALNTEFVTRLPSNIPRTVVR
jgi:alanine racemase